MPEQAHTSVLLSTNTVSLSQLLILISDSIVKFLPLIIKKPSWYVTEDIDLSEEIYDETIDEIWNIIIQAVRDKFGIKKAFIWETESTPSLRV